MTNNHSEYAPYPKAVQDYAVRSLRDRTGKLLAESDTAWDRAGDGEICRIVFSCHRLYLNAAEAYRGKLADFLGGIRISEKIG